MGSPLQPYLTLLMSMVSRASCRRRSLRSRLLSEEEATPPLPVLPPGRCWKSMMRALGFYWTGEKPGEQRGEAVSLQNLVAVTGASPGLVDWQARRPCPSHLSLTPDSCSSPPLPTPSRHPSILNGQNKLLCHQWLAGVGTKPLFRQSD